jgi:hypothetical protein
MKRFALIAAVCALLVMPAQPYTFNFTSGIKDHWASPPSYIVQTTPGANVTGTGSRSVTAVIQSAFSTWANSPNAAAVATFAGNTNSPTLNSTDHVNTVCFTCSGDFSKDSSTLAVTITSTDNSANLTDADIAFNPGRNFSTDNSGNQDLETVAVHEIGHFFGLAHSGVVKAIMFPFAPSLERTLSYDDVAAISVLYPGTISVSVQNISGTVRLNGAGVFGAHVYAESTTNSTPFPAGIRKTPISALTDPNGNYTIQGVPNDAYLISAEPLDLPVSNSDIPDYGKAFNKTAVDTNFTTRWH